MRSILATVFRPWAAAAGFGAVVLLHTLCSAAAVLDFDFAAAALGSNPLGTSVTVGGVNATAYLYNGGTSFTAGQQLWQRNTSDDRGLGICSEGTSPCLGGGGDVNEISNQKNDEVLRLQLPSGKKWTGLTVSSLDSGGTNSAETGTLYWSNSQTPDLSSLTGFKFKFGDFGSNVNGDLFSLPGLAAAGFDTNAAYVYFRAGTGNGTNNDYLVWGGNLSAVPEPSGIALLVAGLTAMGAVAVRRRRYG